MLRWVIPSRAFHSYIMNFLEIFISRRYYRDMKIVEMLASNSKRSESMV